jgi:2-methylcitrate dehydratase
MVYIIASILRKAFTKHDKILESHKDVDELWKLLMLTPLDYSYGALKNETTRKFMDKIEFAHGGPDYDSKFPEGIPTSVEVQTKSGQVFDSGLVMFPGGHSRDTTVALHEVLQHKFKLLGNMALDKQELIRFKVQLENIGEMTNEDLDDLYDCNLKFSDESIDAEGGGEAAKKNSDNK